MFVEPFLPAEIREKVVFAKNLDELLSYVDEEHLPEDLGGKAKSKGWVIRSYWILVVVHFPGTACNFRISVQYVPPSHPFRCRCRGIGSGTDVKSTFRSPYEPPTKDQETKKPASDSERKQFFKELDVLNTAYEDATRKWIKAMDKGASQKEEDKILDERDAIQAARYALCRKGDPLWRASTEISRLGNVREVRALSRLL